MINYSQGSSSYASHGNLCSQAQRFIFVELTLLYPLFASSSASQFLFILYTFYFTLYTKPTTSPAQTS